MAPSVRTRHLDIDKLDDRCLNSTGVHVLLHPSAIRTAPTLDEIGRNTGASDDYEQDVLTVPASLGGLPAISVPSGCGDDGWPLGISIVGQWGTDVMLLDAAESIEECIRVTKGCPN